MNTIDYNTPLREQIKTLLISAPGLTTNVIAKRLDRHPGTIGKVLSRMNKSGNIIKTKQFNNGVYTVRYSFTAAPAATIYKPITLDKNNEALLDKAINDARESIRSARATLRALTALKSTLND